MTYVIKMTKSRGVILINTEKVFNVVIKTLWPASGAGCGIKNSVYKKKKQEKNYKSFFRRSSFVVYFALCHLALAWSG